MDPLPPTTLDMGAMSRSLPTSRGTMRKFNSSSTLPSLRRGNTSRIRRHHRSKSLELPAWEPATSLHSASPNGPIVNSNGCRCASCIAIARQNKAREHQHQLLASIDEPPFRVGERVLLTEDRTGVVKWIGRLRSDYTGSPVHVGVHLDEAIGTHDGIIRGKRYFRCPHNHGVFVQLKDVLLAKNRFAFNYRIINREGLAQVGTLHVSESPSPTKDISPFASPPRQASARRKERQESHLLPSHPSTLSLLSLAGEDADHIRIASSRALSGASVKRMSSSARVNASRSTRGGARPPSLFAFAEEKSSIRASHPPSAASAQRLQTTKKLLDAYRRGQELLAEDPEILTRLPTSRPHELWTNSSLASAKPSLHTPAHSQFASKPSSAHSRSRSKPSSGPSPANIPGALVQTPVDYTPHASALASRQHSTAADDTGATFFEASGVSEPRCAEPPAPVPDQAIAAVPGQEPSLENQRRTSAIKIQAAYRGHQARKEASRRRAARRASQIEPVWPDDPALSLLEANATKIQAAFRGYRARKHLSRNYDENAAPLSSVLASPAKADAASTEELDNVLRQAGAHANAADAIFDRLIQETFLQADLDGDGSLDAMEFASLMASPALNLVLDDEQAAQVMQAVDLDDNGRLEWAEFVPLMRPLLTRIFADKAPSESWVEIYSRERGDVIYLERATGRVEVQLPPSATLYYPSIYQRPRDDFERLALTTFLAADRLGRGYLLPEEFVGILRAPELGLGLSREEEQYYYDASGIADSGYLDYTVFAWLLKQVCARVYLSHAPPGPEWVHVISDDFGVKYYHRVSGESRDDAPKHYATLHSL